VDVSRVTGTGAKGRVQASDVQAYVKEALAGPRGGGGAGLDLLPWPQIDFARFGPVEARPLSRLRRIAGANLARNWVMIPHVTQHDEADITDLEHFRQQVNAGQPAGAPKVTLLAFAMKACAEALRRFPEFNASLDGESLVLKRYVHLGFAADTPNGLVVPVIRDADKKGLLELAAELAALAQKARDGKLQPAEMQGGSFTISSLGGIGGTAFTPIINAPEVAILGLSKASTRPVWDGRAFQPRLLLPLSLSYDHRVIDGAAGARFVTALAALLGDLRRALL
jgi:pyruvate dehydrogenase E2 component (dihydrolipoamide acetyltransferase)